MADKEQVKREIKWYTDEVAANERDLAAAKRKVDELGAKLSKNKKELELYKADLARVERAKTDR